MKMMNPILLLKDIDVFKYANFYFLILLLLSVNILPDSYTMPY